MVVGKRAESSFADGWTVEVAIDNAFVQSRQPQEGHPLRFPVELSKVIRTR